MTHLLHWALHEVVSRDATQKGSYVGPEKLTFDFSSAALTKQQVREVEKLVNEKIAENAPVSWMEIPYPEAKQRTDIMQFFGDKYGDIVRVVQIGGSPNELNGYSMELCGGTHVRTTGDIGSFRILSEGAIAAGIRRIEAIAGNAVGEWARAEAARQEEKFQALARRKSGLQRYPCLRRQQPQRWQPASTPARPISKNWTRKCAIGKKRTPRPPKQECKAGPRRLPTNWRRTMAQLSASLACPDADGKLLQAVTDALKTRFEGPIFLAGEKEGRVALIASVPKALTSRYQAGKLIQETAPLVGAKAVGVQNWLKAAEPM